MKYCKSTKFLHKTHALCKKMNSNEDTLFLFFLINCVSNLKRKRGISAERKSDSGQPAKIMT